MCNLYNISTNQEALRALVSSFDDLLGNLEPSIDVWPDRTAPIIRNGLFGRREAVRTRWGMPSSSFALMQATQKRADKLKAKGTPFDFKELRRMEPDKGTTNVRNTSSRHWARWLGVEHRCVVPVTSFAEPDPASKVDGGPTPNAWFALGATRPLMFFAGLWVPSWESVRKVKDGLTKDDLFAFLTTEPNDVVGAVHSKAMPVLLTTPAEVEHWLRAPWESAKVLQRPLSEGILEIVQRPASPEAWERGVRMS